MNSTNRAVNRIFLIVIGVVVLVVGLAVAALPSIPGWQDSGRSALTSIEDAGGRARTLSVASFGLSEVPWPLLAIPVGAALVIAALLLLIFRQGHGRTDAVVSARPLPAGTDGHDGADGIVTGTLTVDAAVADDVLRRALSAMPAVVAVGVSAYRVKRRAALKLTVTPRRGADPLRVLPLVERVVAEWDELLGQRVPVFVHFNAGVRTALHAPARTS